MQISMKVLMMNMKMHYLLNIAKKLYPFKQDIKTSSHIYIYANRKNSGDFLSAKGVKLAVGVEAPEHVIEKNLPNLKTILEANQDIKLIIGGGGLLKDSFEEFWRIVLLSGTRYVCFGIGICDIKGQNSFLTDDILRKVIANAQMVWVRDSRTSALIENKYGLTVQRILCPSVFYIHRKYAATDKKKTVHGDKPRLLYTHHRKLVRTAKKGDDFIRNMVRQICKTNGFVFSEVDNICRNPARLLKQYANADIIINTRLHGCIFSYALDKPFVAISADTKIDSFVYDYCNADVLDIKQITLEKINNAIHQNMCLSPRKGDFLSNIKGITDAGNIVRTFLSQ